MSLRFYAIIAMVVGFATFMLSEAYYMKYTAGVDTSSTNKTGSQVGMGIGGGVYLIGVILYSLHSESLMFLIMNIIVLGIVLLQVSEYYGIANESANSKSMADGVYVALAFGLCLILTGCILLGTSHNIKNASGQNYASSQGVLTGALNNLNTSMS